MTKLAAPHVRARWLGALLMCRVNQRGNAVCLIFWNCGHFVSLCVVAMPGTGPGLFCSYFFIQGGVLLAAGAGATAGADMAGCEPDIAL